MLRRRSRHDLPVKPDEDTRCGNCLPACQRTTSGTSNVPIPCASNSRAIATRGKIIEIDVIADPARLRQLDLTVLDD